MKIICVGRNYLDHIKELDNSIPEEPLLFIKPSTSVLQQGQPFYIPEFSDNIHYECEVIVKIAKNGKSISPQYASSYYQQVGLGIDFTARDLQEKCKSAGNPWEIAKAFDNSAVIGRFVDKSELEMDAIKFKMYKNDEVVQNGDTSNLIFSIDTLISYISKFFTLQIGDIIFTGTPAGVGKVVPGDLLRGTLGEATMFEVLVK